MNISHILLIIVDETALLITTEKKLPGLGFPRFTNSNFNA
jgi:hypothetical protein